MRVGILRVELQVPDSRSLKDKRRPLKSLIERLQNRFQCAVAEVDHHDLHQRAAIGIAVVADDGSHLAQRLQTVRGFVEGNPDMRVLDILEETGPGPQREGPYLPRTPDGE